MPDEELISGWANVQANNYWSSTTNANNTDNAWNVNMWNGNVNNDNKDNNNYVWPVRAGEWLPLFSFENLYKSYLKCRKNKRNTINALKFEINAEENLFKLSEELENKTYQPSRSVCFVLERPKMREIIAADFRDRIIHHLLVERLEAIYEPIFIYDSYACRKDKGLHKAVERVREFIRKGSKNGREKLYFIHLDIRNFFMTIDKRILYEILKKKVRDEDLLRLARVIIFHNPVENCIIKGKKHLIKNLPSHKSLFYTNDKKGLPVGNLTSQFFANLYLNELDQYVKHTLKSRYYVRYCDDLLILDESPEKLKEIKERIDGFVMDKLNLSLNEIYDSVLPVSNGIDFLGYIIRQDYMLVRRRVINNLRTKLNWFEKILVGRIAGFEECHSRENGNPASSRYSCPVSGYRVNSSRNIGGRNWISHQVRNDDKRQQELSVGQNAIRIICYDYTLTDKLRSVVASYLGHMKWADSYNLRRAIFERYGFIREYFSFDDGVVKPFYRYCQIFPSVKSQYLYYASRFRGVAVFFQVGCFYEFYEKEGRDVSAILNLKKLRSSKRGAVYGFPVRLEDEYARRFVMKGIPVVIIKETDRYIGRIKERLPVMKIVKKEE